VPLWREIMMEAEVLKTRLAAGLGMATLMLGAADAQTAAPSQPAGPGQVMTQMPANLMRASQLMGIDVYGGDNQKIGDIDEVLVDRQGKIHGVVVGVGGFLGIGQKDVAIPFDQVQWMSGQEVRAAANTNQGGGYGTDPAGMNTPVSPGTSTASTGDQPVTTGSAGAPGTGTTGSTAGGGTGGMTGGNTRASGSAGIGNDPNTPARAVVKMTRADLQNAPEFRYSDTASRGTGAAGNTNPPPASANRPGNAPQP
jgi:sporulation protein YlmC with PRC-barrel domain